MLKEFMELLCKATYTCSFEDRLNCGVSTETALPTSSKLLFEMGKKCFGRFVLMKLKPNSHR